MTGYLLLPDQCRECLWRNCCDWIYHRDPDQCRNHLSKKKYICRLNGEEYVEERPDKTKWEPIKEAYISELLGKGGLVMGVMMTFPDTFEEFAEQYKIVDTEHIYTNGTDLIPVFRVKQWLDHLQQQAEEVK